MRRLIVLSLFFSLFAGIALGISTSLSRDFTVERERRIAAAPMAVYRYLEDLNAWDAWDPWLAADGDMVAFVPYRHRGPDAVRRWRSEQGAMALTITLDDPGGGLLYELAVDGQDEPIRGAFRLRPTEDGHTSVTWHIDGRFANPLTGGWLARMMDGSAGPIMADGLRRLDAVVTGRPVPAADR